MLVNFNLIRRDNILTPFSTRKHSLITNLPLHTKFSIMLLNQDSRYMEISNL